MLAAEARADIIAALVERSGQSITALAEVIGRDLGLVSRHVAILASAHVVTVDRVGRESVVSIAPEWMGVIAMVVRVVKEKDGEGDVLEGDE
jgi:DNA-binding transcriptional ArsR family regulator